MNLWRVFGWKSLFRWDVLGVIVPGFFLACGIGFLSIDWFPHNLLISQIFFAILLLLTVTKSVGHAVESEGRCLHRVLFALTLSLFSIALFSPVIWIIQKHKHQPINHRQLAPLVWNQPPPIDDTTPLSKQELNATSEVEGVFEYNPTFGSTLPAGVDTLSVTFTPSDLDHYEPESKTVSIKVSHVPEAQITPTHNHNNVPLSSSGFSEDIPDTVTAQLDNGIGIHITATLKTAELRKQPFTGLINIGGYHPLSLYVDGNTFYVDATITDGQGHSAIRIKKNVLEVQPVNWDVNYSKNAVEIVDANERPIFQMIRKRANLIEVAGLFIGPSGGVFDARPAKALFKYPGWKYPHQYADDTDASLKIDPTLAAMTTAQLQVQIAGLCVGVRELGREWNDGYSANNNRAAAAMKSATSQEERKQVAESRIAHNQQLLESLREQFNKKYGVQARSLSNELSRRDDNPQEDLNFDSSEIPSLLSSGTALGPDPFDDVCNYLSAMSKQIH